MIWKECWNNHQEEEEEIEKKKGSLLSFRLPENFGETFRALDKKKLDPLVWSSLLNNSFGPERLRTTSRESRLLFFAFFKKKKKGADALITAVQGWRQTLKTSVKLNILTVIE